VKHVSIILEHVNFLDLLDRLHVHLLERLLELLVVTGRAGRGTLHLSARCAFPTIISPMSATKHIFLAQVGTIKSSVLTLQVVVC
jgi:hypothetical protein